MMALGPVLILVIVGIVIAVTASNRPAKSAPPAPPAGSTPRRVPVIAEALGYLGGMLAIVGLGLVIGNYWPDLATASRLALSGGGALALLAAAALVREHGDPALVRLRWFLWLAATAATGLFAGVLAVDGLGAEAPETVVLAVAAAVAALSGALWRGRRRPLQELTFLGALSVTTFALIAQFAADGSAGLGLWVVGAVMVVAGVRRWLTFPALADGVGAVTLAAGAAAAAGEWPSFGLPLLVASALVLLAVATVPGLSPDPSDHAVLGAIGAFTLLQGVPPTLVHFAKDAGMLTGLATWAAGAAVLFVGARRLVRAPVGAEILGAAALLGGAAITGVQFHGGAPLFGIATAVALLGLGTRPGQVLLSVFGSLGLLVNVPWAIGWFFPGEGRVPLLIAVAGGLIIVIAIVLSRRGDEFRRDLGGRSHPRPA